MARAALVACVLLAAVLSSRAAVLTPANVTLVYFGDIADRWLPYDNSTGSDCRPDAQNVSTCAFGAARAKTVIAQIDAKFPGECIVAAVGGYAFGAEFARVGNGKFAAQYMTDMGLDVSGTASAEWFDGGTVPAIMANAGYSVVNSDLFTAPNTPLTARYNMNFTASVQVVSGQRIGFFALTDASIVPITSLFGTLGATGYHDDHYIAARRAVQLLDRVGVNKIVMLLQYNIESFALIAAVPGIDAVIVTSDTNPPAGTVEFGLSADGVPVPVLTCTAALTAVCWVQLQFDEFGYLMPSDKLRAMAAAAGGGSGYARGTTVRFDATGTDAIPYASIRLTPETVPDAALKARVNNDYNSVIAPTYANNVAVIAQPLPFDFITSRRQETLLGNALSDALREYAGCDVMLLNSGAIRAGLPQGNCSVGDVQKVLPLAATLTVLRVRGDVLLQILENSVSRVDQSTGTGRFLDPGGLDYGFNPTQPVGARITFVNVWANLTSGGLLPKTPLSVTAFYTIGMSTFDATGGDGFTMLTNNTFATISPGQTQPRLDLATQQVWARRGIVQQQLTGRIVNDTSVTPPSVVFVNPPNAPINGGVPITIYGEGLLFSDSTLTVLVGPLPCQVQSQATVTTAVQASTAIVCLPADASATGAAIGATTITVWRRSTAPLSGNSATVPRVSAGLFAFLPAQQLCAFGAVSTAQGCQCQYPYAPAPETPLRCRTSGEKLENNPDSGSIVLALLVPAFGIWTAQTFLDQSINVGMTKFRILFALMSTLCLSMALWATLAFGVASISLHAAVAYNPVPLMTGLLVSLAGTGLFIGFTVYVVAKPILSTKLPPPDSLAGMFGAAMGDAKLGAAQPGAPVSGASDPRRRAVFGGAGLPGGAGGAAGARGGRAGLVNSNHAVLASHARAASQGLNVTSRYELGKRSDLKGNEWKFSWHVLLASYLLLQAIFTTHFCVFASLRVQAKYRYDAGALAAAFILSALCCAASTISYFWFFTSPLRLGCVLGNVLAQVLFYFIGTARMSFEFDVDAPAYFGSSWSSASVQLAAGLVTVIAVLVFVALALARLRLSQNELSKTASTLRIRLKDAEEAVDKANETVERLQYFLRLIALTRPLDNPKHFQLKLLAQDVAGQEAKDGHSGAAAAAGTGAGANGHDEKAAGPGGVTGAGPNKRGADPNDPTFDEIVQHPATLELLKDIMHANHTLESLSFYLDVLVYKTMKKAKRHSIIQDLITTYVKKGSPYEVNIDALMAQRILQKVERGYIKKDLFDEAEREVQKLIVQNDMPRFQKSENWAIVKLILKHDKNVGLSNVFGADPFGGEDDDDDGGPGGVTKSASAANLQPPPNSPPPPAAAGSTSGLAKPTIAALTPAPSAPAAAGGAAVPAATPFALATPASPKGAAAAPFSMASAFRSAVGASTPELGAAPAAAPGNPAAAGQPLPAAVAAAKLAAPASASAPQRTVGAPLSAAERAKISPFAVDDDGPPTSPTPASPAPKAAAAAPSSPAPKAGAPAVVSATPTNAAALDRPPSFGSTPASPGVRRPTSTQRNRDLLDHPQSPAQSSPAPGPAAALQKQPSALVLGGDTVITVNSPAPAAAAAGAGARAAAGPSTPTAAGGSAVGGFDGVVVGGAGGDAPALARPSSMLPQSKTVRKYDAGFGL